MPVVEEREQDEQGNRNARHLVTATHQRAASAAPQGPIQEAAPQCRRFAKACLERSTPAASRRRCSRDRHQSSRTRTRMRGRSHTSRRPTLVTAVVRSSSGTRTPDTCGFPGSQHIPWLSIPVRRAGRLVEGPRGAVRVVRAEGIRARVIDADDAIAIDLRWQPPLLDRAGRRRTPRQRTPLPK